MVEEQLLSINVLSRKSSQPHVSTPATTSFGAPWYHKDFSTGDPSTQWNCPDPRLMSVADNQKPVPTATGQTFKFGSLQFCAEFLPFRLFNSVTTAFTSGKDFRLAWRIPMSTHQSRALYQFNLNFWQ